MLIRTLNMGSWNPSFCLHYLHQDYSETTVNKMVTRVFRKSFFIFPAIGKESYCYIIYKFKTKRPKYTFWPAQHDLYWCFSNKSHLILLIFGERYFLMVLSGGRVGVEALGKHLLPRGWRGEYPQKTSFTTYWKLSIDQNFSQKIALLTSFPLPALQHSPSSTGSVLGSTEEHVWEEKAPMIRI